MKPAAGAVGLVSQTMQGIANTPDSLLDRRIKPTKVRPQRFIDPAVGLTSYDAALARKFEEEQIAKIREKKKQRKLLSK